MKQTICEIKTDFTTNKIEYQGISFCAADDTIVSEHCSFPVGSSGKALAVYGMTLPEAYVFAGDTIAELTLVYSDKSEVVYPLTIGESLWWGDRFTKYCEPLKSDVHCNQIFCDVLKLTPCRPVKDSDGYILFIRLEDKVLEKIVFRQTGACLPRIRAFTLIHEECDYNFLEPAGVNTEQREAKMVALQDVLYVSPRNFPDHFERSYPAGYSGPRVEFKGDKYADFYTNVFHWNLADAAAKIDADGYGHTSTLGAPWYGYDAIGGLYTTDGRIYPDQKPGMYYAECWTRDLGRAMIELMRFGRGENVAACIDWVFEKIKRWETDDTLLLEGRYRLPRHVQRIIQRFELRVGDGCFENDGHALFALAVWTYWKRCGSGKAWAKERWEDIKALGDWYLWQIANPEISKSKDSLWADSEATGWDGKNLNGISLYVDYVSAEALYALSEIALEQGDKASADKWSECADNLKKASEKNFLGEGKYGRCFCKNESWGEQTSLGSIIVSTDRRGYDVFENEPQWREYNERTGRINCETHDFYFNAFGYSHGYSIQNALLMDDMASAAKFLRECAMMIYNPVTMHYLIPENAYRVKEHMYTRTGDLGNQVQQAEMLKAMRLIIGIDDTGDELKFTPRLPDGWDEVTVERYPVVIKGENKHINYKYNKITKKLDWSIV